MGKSKRNTPYASGIAILGILLNENIEDNLMRLFGSERISKMMDRMGHKEGEVIQAGGKHPCSIHITTLI